MLETEDAAMVASSVVRDFTSCTVKHGGRQEMLIRKYLNVERNN